MIFYRALILLGLSALMAASASAQFHAGSRNAASRNGACPPPATDIPALGVDATDGVDKHGRRVVPATLEASPIARQFDSVDIDMQLPVDQLINPGNFNVNTSEMKINLGTMNVQRDGTTTLNGAPLTTNSNKCQ
jgi:hypothetical protein